MGQKQTAPALACFVFRFLRRPPEEAKGIGLGSVPGLHHYIREYRNGRDLTDIARGVKVIDLFGLTADDVRARFPAVYQWVLERVKPERDQNNRSSYRNNWWIHGETRKELRKSLIGLKRYIATVETAKHRAFQFLDASVLPDNMVIAISSDDAYHLGVLSSAVHVNWALATGGRLGVGNDPRYNKTRCFETFPFPSQDIGLTPALHARIGALAEALDAHRKRQQAAHHDLTLTGMYNVLEKLRTGESLSAKDKRINEQGLVNVLRTLHDELDAAVLGAYGWSDLATAINNRQAAATAILLQRLVLLNAARAAEEASGTVRWLRPEFQNPAVPVALSEPEQRNIALEGGAMLESSAIASTNILEWPTSLPDQVQAVTTALAAAPLGLSLGALAAKFKGKGQWKKDLPPILETLAAFGRARSNGDLWHNG